MDVTKKTKCETTITVTLTEWEARDLRTMLSRVANQRSVSKSEFSMREKITGRRLLTQLHVTL